VDETAKNDWVQVRRIFDDALSYSPEIRPQFVRTACGANESLLAEVQSLLDSHDSAESFLETPALIAVAGTALGVENRLASGATLLHYEIRSLIGSGGMGEVYLARDTRLNRNVAIKLLRTSFLPDAEAKRRLLREARAAALLEHPNICQIYEISEADEYSFIVMQYVVGTTLADTLAARRPGIASSLDIAVQIVDGLAEAHAQGIIHRDIKPANIMVNEKGQVKILDFGLAKFVEAETNAATIERLNSSGIVMGTVPFMSPEQLCGKAVDTRTDLFSVGALLYEMVAGRPAFNRDNNAETISAILNDEPDHTLVPEALRPIVRRCLAKDVEHRSESAAVLLHDLREVRNRDDIDSLALSSATSPVSGVSTDDSVSVKKRQFHFWQSSSEMDAATGPAFDKASVEVTRPKRRISWLPLAAASAVVLVGIGAVWIWQWNQGAAGSNFDSLQSSRLVSWKSGAVTSPTDFTMSHDGRMIAYSSAAGRT
jgi:serine/threonine protein kinase